MSVWAIEKDPVQPSIESEGRVVLFKDGGPGRAHSEKDMAVVLNQGRFCHPGDIWQCGDIFGYYDLVVGWGWRLVLLSLSESGPGMLLNHHTGHRAAPTTDSLGPRCQWCCCVENLGPVNSCSIRMFLLRGGSHRCWGVTRYIWVLNIPLGAVGEWTWRTQAGTTVGFQ